jgi:4Fe-4S ferredoxin
VTARVKIDLDTCIGCGKCEASCPTDVIRFDTITRMPAAVYPEDCCACLLCVDDCPAGCISIDRAKTAQQIVSIYDQLPSNSN